MKKQILFMFLIILVSFTVVNSQTLVIPGENALSTAIAEASDGDVIQLITGGEYTETASPVGIIDKKIVIELENYEEGMDKAKVYFTEIEEGDGDRFFALRDGADITVRGIEFDGRVDGSIAVEYLMQADITETPVDTWIDKVLIEDCYVHHFNDHVVSGGSPDMKGYVVFDSIFVHNSVMHDMATTVYSKQSAENYIEVTNSTFYKLTSYGLRVSGPGESGDYEHTAEGYVDHTTWYDVGSLDGREIIQIEKGPNRGPWIVTNSIFEYQRDLDRTVINIKDVPDNESIVSNIAYWNVGPRSWNNNGIKIVHDTLHADPEFVDPENGDFTIPEGSVLYTFGTDGGAIGDPRWAVYPVSVEQEEGAVPDEFLLYQNYPNPFNPETRIKFTLSEAGFTTLKVFDILGREVAALINKQLDAGLYNYQFDASNLSSGVYIYQLTSGNMKTSKKMLLNK